MVAMEIAAIEDPAETTRRIFNRQMQAVLGYPQDAPGWLSYPHPSWSHWQTQLMREIERVFYLVSLEVS